jgi:LysM domain
LKRKRVLQAAAMFVVLLSSVAGTAQDVEERPQIFLEKKVYSETVGGKRNFYEEHTVAKGDSLWKLLERKQALTPARFADRLKEFRRANPGVPDPSRLLPGQKILVPAGEREKPVDETRTAAYDVKKGDSLTRILASRGVPRTEWKKFLDAVKEINASVKDVDRIYAGSTLRLPTEAYFGEPPTEVAATEPGETTNRAEPEPVAPTPAPSVPVEPAPAATALTKDVPPAPGQDVLVPAKPQAELLAPKGGAPEAPLYETGKSAEVKDGVRTPARFPYRGLLTDLFGALGEKWVEKGTMYLPLPSGGEVVLQLPDFPLVKFPGGEEALIDFGGRLPASVRKAIMENWSHIRVVSLEDVRRAEDAIDRVLRVSGYYSVKDGRSRPVVIGESVAVVLPARWVIQRTEDSLLSGDLVLVKETAEKPDADLLAVLRYARRVGVRVLPFSDDPAAKEGFLVGLGDEEAPPGIPVATAVPEGGGLPAVDFGLSFLGIAGKSGERLRIGGKDNAFQLVVQPERVFEANGRKYAVDTGRMSDAIRSILKESGYSVFAAGKDETGRAIFERLVKIAGGTMEERREYLVAGGARAGYAVRVTGAFISLPSAVGGTRRTVVLVHGKVHSATRTLLGDLGVEIVEWSS